MRQLHNAIIVSLITASLLAAAAIATPTIAKAEQADAPNAPAPASGPWRSPVGALDLLTRFDPPPEPWLPGHRGVDLAAGPSLPVTAAGAGTVVFADDLAGRGVVSIVHDNGLRTTYEPVEPLVAAGETVTAGQTIGHLQPGHASCPGQACLHLGLKRGPLYLDPMLLFGKGKVRLLPRPGRAEAER
jgi:murein DD-endopeptidase MepM/ murein hydrolase activator NlpD